ncbi:MAG: hypothetical protein HY721_33015 [Planctomycetes bacterium]|nr:hypothetical protein [Planctomycetota bacterium]
MKSLCLTLVLASLVAVGLGCAMPRSPIPGILFANVSDGLAVGTGDVSNKVGESMATSIVGITLGDASIKAAADKGGIKKIGHVDYHSWGVLGVYSTTTTRVYGE